MSETTISVAQSHENGKLDVENDALGLVHAICEDPLAFARKYLATKQNAVDNQTNCAKAEQAAAELQGILEGLLKSQSTLHYLDNFHIDESGDRWAMVAMGNCQRQLPVHPDVADGVLENLQPWEMVKVDSNEVVVGIFRHRSLFSRALSEVVSFSGWHDEAQGLAKVQRAGQDDQVVMLAPRLIGAERSHGDRLILMRSNDRICIDVMPKRSTESQYEMNIDEISTQLSDLAGVDNLLSQLIEDLLLRLIHRETIEQFDLEPLKGMLLYSHKAGMGKTTIIRAVIRWVADLGKEQGFDVALYSVAPNSLKSMWHGQDAVLVRDELCGAIRQRLKEPRERPLFIFVVFDEVESLGNRNRGQFSTAQNDAVQALLAEIDGMDQMATKQLDTHNAVGQVLWIGLTNRPDMLDPALKRPGRFGDLILEIGEYDVHAAEKILAVHAKNAVPWYVDGQIQLDLSDEEVLDKILRPAISHVFSKKVLRYFSEARQGHDVLAGSIMSASHYKNAVNHAKRLAAVRKLRGDGIPAVSVDDMTECLINEAISVASQLAGDKEMLSHQLQIKQPIIRTEQVPASELKSYRYIRTEK